jgi:hypothetical protein
MKRPPYYPFSENPIVDTRELYKITREISLQRLREEIRKERLEKTSLEIVK